MRIWIKAAIKRVNGFLILIIKWALHALIYLWSFCPVLCLTHDENYCEISKGQIKGKTNLRFSFVNLFLGSFYVCLITFPINSTNNEKFQLIKLLTIKEAIDKNERKLLEKNNQIQSETNIAIKKEAAYYKLQQMQSNVGVTQNKINNVLSICLVITPIIVVYLYSLFDIDVTEFQCCKKIILYFGIVLCLYSILCIIFLLLKNLNRETITRAKLKFNDDLCDANLVEIIRDDTDYESIRSLVLTTMLLQIRKSLAILIIAFALLGVYYII